MTLLGNSHIAEAADADSSTWFAFFSCDACRYTSMGRINVANTQELFNSYLSLPGSTNRPYVGETSIENMTKIVDFFIGYNNFDIEWIPSKPLGKEYEDVPTDIASAASEAYACFSINQNRAAVLMARTTLEATAKQHGITEGKLFNKIEKMAEQNIITDQLKEEAHEIRMLGNDMAHGDLGTPVTEDDAADILGFLDTVLDYVYQQPMAIQKRRDLRARRKAKEQASN